MPWSPTFTRQFEAHRGSVVRYVRRRLGDDAAEDAAIAIFRRAADARPSEQARYGSPRPWLFALASHAVSERWRLERHRLEAFERHVLQPPARHPALELSAPLDPQVANLLRCLPSADRETLLLIAWGELTADETASAQGVPVPLVRTRLAGIHAEVVDRTRREDTRSSEPTAAGLVDVLSALGDHADLGLDPVRQPRIESAVSRHFAAPRDWRLRLGEPQLVGG